MNEQAWKEQAARVLAASDGLNYDEVCGVDADPDNGYCDSGTCVAAFYEDHDADHARVMYNKHAAALYPLVQQAIATERGEPVAWMYKSVFGTEICRFRWGADEGLTSDHWVGWAETPLYTLRTQIFGEASDGE